jgi:hypothetical protein
MNPAEINPHAQTSQVMSVAKVKDAFQKAEEKLKSDSVNISKEALRMAREAQGFTDEPEYDSKDEEEQDEVSDSRR